MQGRWHVSDDKQPLLSIDNLTVNFGSGESLFRAVNNLSIKIYPEEIVGLIGESGSGKTTCVHSILGLVDGLPGVSKGTATFSGQSILPNVPKYLKVEKDQPVGKKKLGYFKEHKKLLKKVLGRDVTAIFQEPKSALNPYFSIGEHLLECIERGEVKEGNPIEYGKEILSQVGIVDGSNVWKQYPHQLSGGMAQRVMIAMALASHPKLLIADEPTTALDVTTQAKLLQLFLKFRKEKKLAIMMISHDIGVIREITDRVYVMYKGDIVEQGKTKDVIDNPQHEYTQMLLKSFNNLAVKG